MPNFDMFFLGEICFGAFFFFVGLIKEKKDELKKVSIIAGLLFVVLSLITIGLAYHYDWPSNIFRISDKSTNNDDGNPPLIKNVYLHSFVFQTNELDTSPISTSKAKNNVGVAYSQDGDYPSAEKCFAEAKAIFEENNNYNDKILVECNIANIVFIQAYNYSAELDALKSYEKLYDSAFGLLPDEIVAMIKENLNAIWGYIEGKNTNVSSVHPVHISAKAISYEHLANEEINILEELVTILVESNTQASYTIMNSDRFTDFTNKYPLETPITLMRGILLVSMHDDHVGVDLLQGSRQNGTWIQSHSSNYRSYILFIQYKDGNANGVYWRQEYRPDVGIFETTKGQILNGFFQGDFVTTYHESGENYLTLFENGKQLHFETMEENGKILYVYAKNMETGEMSYETQKKSDNIHEFNPWQDWPELGSNAL